MNEVTKIKKIERDPVAIKLDYNGFDANGGRIEFNELNIRFKDIKNATVGDKFTPEEGNLQNYYLESAEIMCKTDEDAIIRICFAEAYNDTYDESYDMIHVVFD